MQKGLQNERKNLEAAKIEYEKEWEKIYSEYKIKREKIIKSAEEEIDGVNQSFEMPTTTEQLGNYYKMIEQKQIADCEMIKKKCAEVTESGGVLNWLLK
jgi:hypothetical protein